jgi:hypothetical protein
MFATVAEKLIVAALSLALLGIAVWWLEHRGAERVEVKDQAAAAAAIVHNAKIETAATIAGSTEDRNREDALARPVAPAAHGSLQPAPRAAGPGRLPATGPAAAQDGPGADGRGDGTGGCLRSAEAATAVAAVLGAVNDHLDRDVRRDHAADVEIADRNELLRIRDAAARGQPAKGPEPLP